MRLYFLFFSFSYSPQHSMCYCELRRHLINAGWLSTRKAQAYFKQMSFGDTPFITYPLDKTSHPQIPPNIYYFIFKGPSHSPQGGRRGQSYIPILTGERNWYIKSVTVLCHGNPASQPGSRSQLGSRSGSKYQRGTCQNPSLLQDGSFSEEAGGSQHEIKCLAKHKGRLPNTVRSLHLTFREHSVHAINLHSVSAHFTINTSDSLSWEVFFILINSMQNII